MYIGILLDFSNLKALIIGAIIAVAIMLLRNTASFIAKNFMPYDKKIMNSIFARGLAAAVLAQLAMQNNLQNAELISKIAFSVIMFTIIFSSVRIFLVNREYMGKKAITQS
ncbi:cation:proton antiporter [Candidatus Woesearchaeota archaeon]|nr:cation:proton antiporter [Candidatus Woesearchaeota archaeon]